MRWIVMMGLAMAAMGLSACGGDDSTSGAGAATASTPSAGAPATETNTPTIEEPGTAEASSNVEAVRTALEGAGYTVEDEDVSGTPIASLRAGDASVAFYRNTADASEDASAIKAAFKDNPGRGSVRTNGTRVYFVGQERNLTPAERADFLKLVSIAEGAL